MSAERPAAGGETAIRERWVEVPGGRVWVGSLGDGGMPLVTVHGGPGSSHDYLLSLAPLADRWPVAFYDQLGCGRSERPAEPELWRIERFVAELAAVIEALGHPRVHLFGHSWGTMLALEYALAHGERVASLVLASPCLSMRRIRGDMERLISALPPAVVETIERHEAAGTTGSGTYRAAVQVFLHQYVCRMPEWPELLQRSEDVWSRDVYRTMWGPTEFRPTGNLRDYEREDRLAELEMPVLYLCGRHDEITPESTAAYCEATPGARIVIFEESAHVAHLEEREPFLAVVREFLNGWRS